jgi:hypothetical protein
VPRVPWIIFLLKFWVNHIDCIKVGCERTYGL